MRLGKLFKKKGTKMIKKKVIYTTHTNPHTHTHTHRKNLLEY